jgi:hypothetical protein
MKIEQEIKKVYKRAMIFTLIITSLCLAKPDAGLIFTGIDTIDDVNGSFDFIMQRACTSSTDNTCYYQIAFGFNTDNYEGSIHGQGAMVDVGKVNLDSIMAAPSDSLMKDDLGLGQPYVFFKIKPDSMMKCIGNVYIIKTGLDPRRGNHMFAKLKILGFNWTDIDNHHIKMRFLWVFNNNGFRDLRSSGLDTFNLESPVMNINTNTEKKRKKNFIDENPKEFIIIGKRFSIPPEIVGKVKRLTVYNLLGKKIKEIKINNEIIIEINEDVKSNSISIIKTF